MKATRAMTAKRRLGPTAATASLLVLPAAALIALAILRLLQPVQFEPARTATVLFDWFGQWMSPPLAAVLFLLLPLIALTMGMAMLARHWRATPSLRADALTAVVVVRRNLAAIVLAVTTVAAAGILAASLWHMIVG